MIQRIQTVYLLLAAACATLMIFLPLYYIKTGELTEVKTGGDFIALAIVLGFFALDCVVVIFMFRNRPRQLILLLGMSVLIVVILALLFLNWQQLKNNNPDGNVEFEFTVLLAVAMYVLLFMARKAIRKDEELVKSLDRLR